MNKLRFLTLLLLVVAGVNGWGQSEIDSERSTVDFTISNNGKEVKGSLKGITGTIFFSPDMIGKSHFSASIPVKNIRTGNTVRDEHLLQEDFFFAANFPNIDFMSTGVTQTAAGYVLNGKLTFHGISKEVSIPFTYSADDKKFEGAFELMRLDYGVGDDDTKAIGNSVSISLVCYTK